MWIPLSAQEDCSESIGRSIGRSWRIFGNHRIFSRHIFCCGNWKLLKIYNSFTSKSKENHIDVQKIGYLKQESYVLFCFVLFVFGLQLKVRYSPNRIHKVTGKFTNTDRSKAYFWFAWILNGFSMSFCRGWKETHLPWFSGRHCKWRGTTRWAASWGCCCSRSDENCSDNLGGGYFHCQSPKFTRDRHPQSNKLLGGGVKYFFIFTPNPGEMVQFDEHIFQMGWKHQLVIVFMGVELSL